MKEEIILFGSAMVHCGPLVFHEAFSSHTLQDTLQLAFTLNVSTTTTGTSSTVLVGAGRGMTTCAPKCLSTARRWMPPNIEGDVQGSTSYVPFVVLRKISDVVDVVQDAAEKVPSAQEAAQEARNELASLGEPVSSTRPAAVPAQPMVEGDQKLPDVVLLPDLVLTVECLQGSQRLFCRQIPLDNVKQLLGQDVELTLRATREELLGQQQEGQDSAKDGKDGGDAEQTTQAQPRDAYALSVNVALRIQDLSGTIAPFVLCEDDNEASASTSGIPCSFVTTMSSSSSSTLPRSASAFCSLPPYGCMPLFTLYDHFVHFFRVHLRKPIKVNGHLRSKLGQQNALKSDLCDVEGLASTDPVAWRWELLQILDCSTMILGDAGFAPVAPLLACITSLRRLDVSQSSLSLPSARRLVVALRSHPNFKELYASNNLFYELAGEELLRLAKACPALVVADLRHNTLSARLEQRFKSLLEYNSMRHDTDPFNALSAQFDYLMQRDSIPEECWKLVDPLWRMMTVVPPMVPTTTPALGVPIAATAPLLSNLLRGLLIDISKQFRDPVIRSVFAPVGAYAAVNTPPTTRSQQQGNGNNNNTASHTTETHHVVQFSPNTFDVDAESMYLQSYAKLLVTALRVALDAPNHWEDCAQVLRAIGAQHERCGLQPWMYCTANRLFLKAVEAHIPEDDFSTDAKAALIQVLALVTRVAVSGMQCVG